MNKRHSKVLIILTLGLFLGITSSIGDILPFGSAFFIIGGFLNTASVWCLSAFAVGTNFKSRRYAIIVPISFLVLSILGYYIFGYFWGDRSEVPVITLVATSLSWMFIALFVGALCGLSGMIAKHSRDIKKRMIAVTVPMVIIITESIISLIQLLPYLSTNSSNFIPFLILSILILVALSIPFFVYRNKRISLYNMILGLILSIVGALVLMGISTI